MASMLPVFLDLKDRSVLLVGGKASALEKLAKLIPTEAKLKVVARSFDQATLALLSQHGVSWEEREFKAEDCAGQTIVIAAVDQPEQHQLVAAACRGQGVLVNTVDFPATCDFYLAAQLQRGPLQLAISTSGLFPGVAGAIRSWLEELFPADMTQDLEELIKLRLALRQHLPDPRERMRALKAQLQLWLRQGLPSVTGESA